MWNNFFIIILSEIIFVKRKNMIKNENDINLYLTLTKTKTPTITIVWARGLILNETLCTSKLVIAGLKAQ